MSSSGRSLVRSSLAEGLGTFVIVLVGAGAVCVSDSGHGPMVGSIGVALASGFALAAMMLALGTFSPVLLNPAATLAALIAGNLTRRTATRHIVAQLLGAAAAGVALRALFPAAVHGVSLGAPVLGDGVTLSRGVTAEAIVAFAWFVTLAASAWRESSSEVTAVAVGLVYTTAIIFAGPLTGAAGNPARAFGPAFAAGVYTDQAVYWLGPALGAIAAGVVQLALFRRRPKPVASERGDGRDGEAALHYRNGVALYQQGDLEQAAQEFSAATELRPDWAAPYYYIGIVYREFGDQANADAFFDAAMYFHTGCRELHGRGWE